MPDSTVRRHFSVLYIPASDCCFYPASPCGGPLHTALVPMSTTLSSLSILRVGKCPFPASHGSMGISSPACGLLQNVLRLWPWLANTFSCHVSLMEQWNFVEGNGRDQKSAHEERLLCGVIYVIIQVHRRLSVVVECASKTPLLQPPLHPHPNAVSLSAKSPARLNKLLPPTPRCSMSHFFPAMTPTAFLRRHHAQRGYPSSCSALLPLTFCDSQTPSPGQAKGRPPSPRTTNCVFPR